MNAARIIVLIAVFSVGLLWPAFAAEERVVVPPGTPVTLVFDEALSSKTATAGQQIKLHVAEDVKVGTKVVIRKDTAVTGVITKVEPRRRFGVNASLRIALKPVQSVQGHPIPLQPRTQGGAVGRKTRTAGAASVGGAVVLGPVGLVGGYFVSGKHAKVKAGDKLETEVAAPPKDAKGKQAPSKDTKGKQAPPRKK